MNAGEYLELARQMPFGSIDQLTDGSPFVVLAPHPDDETLGAGGLIAAACAQGLIAEMVVLTDGSRSHPRSLLYPRERLIDVRKAELAQATSILGLPPRRVHHFGVGDTEAPSSGPLFQTLLARLTKIIRRTGSKSLFVTWRQDPHCDHAAAAALAKALRAEMSELRLWAYPIWGWHLDKAAAIDELLPPRGFRLDITQQQATKKRAIAAHASQMTALVSDDPTGFRFTADTLAPFLGPTETYIEVP